MPTIKETHFFSGPPEGIPYARGTRRIERLEDYEELFDSTFEIRGEASPTYTVYPRRSGVPDRIKSIIPKAKLIYLVRDPVARTLSHYHHSVSVDGERRTLRRVLGDLSDPYCPLTCAGFYARQLDRFLRCFSEEQILIVDQADLLADRQATLREIFTFISVDDSFVSPLFTEKMNTGKERRKTHSAFVTLHRRAGAPVLDRLPRRMRRSLRWSAERILTRPLEPPTLDDDLQDRLRELYTSDVMRLRELTGKTFPTWSV